MLCLPIFFVLFIGQPIYRCTLPIMNAVMLLQDPRKKGNPRKTCNSRTEKFNPRKIGYPRKNFHPRKITHAKLSSKGPTSHAQLPRSHDPRPTNHATFQTRKQFLKFLGRPMLLPKVSGVFLRFVSH